jgi:type VI secretion system secreted protein Hcp
VANTPLPGAGDMYLKVNGARSGDIKGESIDDKHKDEIEVLSWSWGMQGKSSLAGGTKATGRTTINELRIVKRLDSASTALMLALRTNEPIKSALLTLRKAGKGQLEYFKITIGDARVNSLTIEGGDATGSAEVVEKLSFTFNKIEIEYTPQGKDGLPRGGMLFQDEFTEA